jgi:hypothetical protein
MPDKLNKEQVLFYLTRATKRLDVPSQEEMAKSGDSYEARQMAERLRKERANEVVALEIAKELGAKYYNV